MQATRRIKLICLALIALKAADARTPARGESSGEYLQKVMFQLQEFNVPSSVKVHDRLNDYKSNEKQGYAVQRINMNARQTVQRYRNHTFPRYNVLPSEKIDLRRVDSESISQYYQVKEHRCVNSRTFAPASRTTMIGSDRPPGISRRNAEEYS